jgi:hypothetical protein
MSDVRTQIPIPPPPPQPRIPVRLSVPSLITTTVTIARKNWGLVLAILVATTIFDLFLSAFIYSLPFYTEMASAGNLQRAVLLNSVVKNLPLIPAAFFLTWILTSKTAGAQITHMNTFGRFASLVGVALLSGVGTLLGLMFLIVPGIIVSVLWSVSAPIVIAEGKSPLQALKRSVDLTRGHRWLIFAGMLVCALIGVIIRVICQGVYQLFFGDSPSPLIIMLVSVPTNLIGFVGGLLPAIFSVALYFALMGGNDDETLTSAFD